MKKPRDTPTDKNTEEFKATFIKRHCQDISPIPLPSQVISAMYLSYKVYGDGTKQIKRVSPLFIFGHVFVSPPHHPTIGRSSAPNSPPICDEINRDQDCMPHLN